MGKQRRSFAPIAFIQHHPAACLVVAGVAVLVLPRLALGAFMHMLEARNGLESGSLLPMQVSVIGFGPFWLMGDTLLTASSAIGTACLLAAACVLAADYLSHRNR